MIVKYISFTEKGLHLAQNLASKLGGEAERCGQNGVQLAEWTAAAFAAADALVFVGAAGIAVRAIAPYCRSKATDPAVVAVDECGKYAVPLLSGHLGGANDLARAIAAACGAVPVITTATDSNGIFAVDEWARRQGCAVIEPGRIKRVSAALLAGQTVSCYSDWKIEGEAPAGVRLTAERAGADFCLSVYSGAESGLHIAPRVGVLGVGCKRGTSAAALEQAFATFIHANNIWPQCICAAATIDIKRDEAGLGEFCANRAWPLSFYSAAQLESAPGSFAPSAFVKSVTGVDNVCERAAVLAAGGPLITPKWAGGGVTFALALRPFELDWRWQL